MKRRGFLGMLGAAAAVPFIPHVLEESRKVGELRPAAKPPEAPLLFTPKRPMPIEQAFKTIKASVGDVAVFESKYKRMRVQLRNDMDGAAQFEDGFYRTDEPWKVEAMLRAELRNKDKDFWLVQRITRGRA